MIYDCLSFDTITTSLASLGVRDIYGKVGYCVLIMYISYHILPWDVPIVYIDLYNALKILLHYQLPMC